MDTGKTEMECLDLSCCICGQEYSDHQVPRSLSCGHSFCSMCVDQLIMNDRRCPECREHFSAFTVTAVPINYPVLNFSRLCAYENIDSNHLLESNFVFHPPSEAEPRQHAGTCAAHACPLFFMCITCGVWICRNCFVNDHPDPPRGRCFILSIREAIDKLKKSHTQILDEYIDESNTVKSKLETAIRSLDGSLVIYRNSHSKFGLTNLTNLQELQKHRDCVASSLHTFDDLTESLKKAKTEITNSKSPKEISVSTELSNDCQTVFEKVVEVEANAPNVLNMLLGGKKDLRELVQGEKPVYVVYEENSQTRWAKIVLNGTTVHMYSLRDGTPPEDGIKLPFELVRALVPNDSPLAFLEVGWGGKVKGHVYIRLVNDTPRSRQALFLCSVEKGPFYRNTCFNGSFHMYRKARILFGGDYENNDGTGGRALVEGITDGLIYRKPIRAGLFVSFPANEEWRLGSFAVYLYDSTNSWEDTAFGSVERGLEILKEAATISPLNSASVLDCGLVIPVQN